MFSQEAVRRYKATIEEEKILNLLKDVQPMLKLMIWYLHWAPRLQI